MRNSIVIWVAGFAVFWLSGTVSATVIVHNDWAAGVAAITIADEPDNIVEFDYFSGPADQDIVVSRGDFDLSYANTVVGPDFEFDNAPPDDWDRLFGAMILTDRGSDDSGEFPVFYSARGALVAN